MTKYLYNDMPISEERVINAAANSGLSVDDYVKKHNFTVIKSDEEKIKEDEPISWFEQTWFGRGFEAASTTGEATDLMSQDFSNINKESVQDFIRAKKQESETYQASQAMQEFQKQYVKEGKTWAAFFRGVRKNPKLLPELFIQSIGTQVGTLADSPGATLAAVGAGAATGAGAGATTFTNKVKLML